MTVVKQHTIVYGPMLVILLTFILTQILNLLLVFFLCLLPFCFKFTCRANEWHVFTVDNHVVYPFTILCHLQCQNLFFQPMFPLHTPKKTVKVSLCPLSSCFNSSVRICFFILFFYLNINRFSF